MSKIILTPNKCHVIIMTLFMEKLGRIKVNFKTINQLANGFKVTLVWICIPITAFAQSPSEDLSETLIEIATDSIETNYAEFESFLDNPIRIESGEGMWFVIFEDTTKFDANTQSYANGPAVHIQKSTLKVRGVFVE